jgi:glycosyltransferase involved in cell wall biosynthesis
MNNPSLSVVLAARNEALHLEEALKSILMQDGVEFELIYVDDHSNDNSLEIAKELSRMYPRLKIEKNPKRGKCSAFNFGVGLASGRFVCIFAGDDVMPAGSLKARYDAVAAQSDDFCVVGVSKLITMSEMKKYDGHLIPRAKGRGALSGVSPLMNRKALSKIFPTPEHLPNEDTWMELAVLHMPGWKIIHSDTICCRWRVHVGNSVNMAVSFQEFNRKITIRMEALTLFMQKFGVEIDLIQKEVLQNKIALEEARRRGDWRSILRSNCGLVDRLRALSVANKPMYTIRKSLYGLLSGW